MLTGIENFLSMDAIEERFYAKNRVDDKKGKIVEIQELDKMALCDYLCGEQRDVEDFADFAVVVDIIRSWLRTLGSISGPALGVGEGDGTGTGTQAGVAEIVQVDDSRCSDDSEPSE